MVSKVAIDMHTTLLSQLPALSSNTVYDSFPVIPCDTLCEISVIPTDCNVNLFSPTF